MTWCANYGEASSLLFVHDHTIDISFLVDSHSQISLTPATKTYGAKELCKFTLLAVNKSLIQTYEQKCLFLNLAFGSPFVIAYVESAYIES